jgi:hypothetical protein
MKDVLTIVRGFTREVKSFNKKKIKNKTRLKRFKRT